MCGIFGLVRNQNAAHPERATAVISELGKCSVERGRDSSGLAYISPTATRDDTRVTSAVVRSKNSSLNGGVHVVKDTVPFNAFWDDKRDSKLSSVSAAIIGHTRAATQGSRHDLANTSPLAVGTVVGTHNGDIDADSVAEWVPARAKFFGGTDTESLYRAIDGVRSHRGKIRNILSSAEGRVALAWYDRKYPNRINLARGGLSPLVVAIDNENNLYWASSPEWFKKIEETFEGMVRFDNVFIIPEGTLITVTFDNGEPEIQQVRNFQPVVRSSDTMLSDSIIWRGWVESDMKIDHENQKHNVVPTRPRKVTTIGTGYLSTPPPIGGTTSPMSSLPRSPRVQNNGEDHPWYDVPAYDYPEDEYSYWGTGEEILIEGTSTTVDNAITQITQLEESGAGEESIEPAVQFLDEELGTMTDFQRERLRDTATRMVDSIFVGEEHLRIMNVEQFDKCKNEFKRAHTSLDMSDTNLIYVSLVLLTQFPSTFLD